MSDTVRMLISALLLFVVPEASSARDMRLGDFFVYSSVLAYELNACNPAINDRPEEALFTRRGGSLESLVVLVKGAVVMASKNEVIEVQDIQITGTPPTNCLVTISKRALQ